MLETAELTTSHRLRDIAASAALKAGKYLTTVFRRPMDIQHKADPHDQVTIHDRAAEHLIREVIAQQCPGSIVVGEENGAAPAGQSPPGTDNSHIVWHVDPIDGTSNFAQGLAFFCTSIAVEIDGEVRAAAVYDPMAQLLCTADDDAAYLNGSPLDTPTALPLPLATLITGYPTAADLAADGETAVEGFQRCVDAFSSVRRTGSGALSIVHVAAGWTDVTGHRGQYVGCRRSDAHFVSCRRNLPAAALLDGSQRPTGSLCSGISRPDRAATTRSWNRSRPRLRSDDEYHRFATDQDPTSDHHFSGRTRRSVQVSRVAALRGETGVSSENRQRVLQAAQELGYRLNSAARSLVAHESGVLGVVLNDIGNAHHAQIVTGVETAARQRGLRTLITHGAQNADELVHQTNTLLEMQVDGLIVVSSWMPEDTLQSLGQEVPTVVVAHLANPPAQVDLVADDFAGSTAAGKHLLEVGRSRVAYLTCSMSATSKARWHGIREQVQAAGVEPELLHFGFDDVLPCGKDSQRAAGIASSRITIKPRPKCSNWPTSPGCGSQLNWPLSATTTPRWPNCYTRA